MESATITPAAAGTDLGDRISRGTVAGIGAGLAFLLANMGWATTDDLPAVAPLIDISTIFNIQDEPVPTPENVAVGLVTHLGLSAAFGIGFALIATRLGDLRRLVLGRPASAWRSTSSTSRSWDALRSRGSRRDRTRSSSCSRTRASGSCWCRSSSALGCAEAGRALPEGVMGPADPKILHSSHRAAARKPGQPVP